MNYVPVKPKLTRVPTVTAASSPDTGSSGPAGKHRHRNALPSANGDSSTTRQRLIEAALDAVHKYGYHRASSNKIAEHAGLTWGVIQYHFGTRERLLLAALTAAIDKIDRSIDAMNGQLPGTTFDERFDAWEALVFESFGYELFPAIVQIVLDLGRDPSVADDTIAELERYNSTVERFAHLAEQFGGDGQLAEGVGDYIYWSSWSTALAQSMSHYLGGIPAPQSTRRRDTLRAATATLVADAATRH